MSTPTNILFITADDMNWDAVGAYGCPVPDTTPHLNELAAQGVRFQHAHVTIAVCQPSRSTLLTGRYPHRCGGEGFYHLRFPEVPMLPDLLRKAGYAVGILGKVSHSTPHSQFQWDLTQEMNDLGYGRNPALYRQHAERFIAQAQQAGKPFFLMANAHDPHRPFFGNDKPEWYVPGAHPCAAVPSRQFAPAEVTTPGFLPDLPEVRREIAEYYSSVRRCDDTVGQLLEVLRETGTAADTLVVFLSDNGMAFPFAKTNCYLNSTRTPWLMRWPGRIAPGRLDATHFISGIDLTPTLLEVAGVPAPQQMDGTSFLPLLRGEAQPGRTRVFTQFHQTAGRRNYPIRCVQNQRFGYLFNPWSNGERVFLNESQVGRTMAAMKDAAREHPDIAARVAFFLHRTVEEFYDFAADPHALHNLIDDPAYAPEVDALRSELKQWMQETDDPALAALRRRQSPQACAQFMLEVRQVLGGTS